MEIQAKDRNRSLLNLQVLILQFFFFFPLPTKNCAVFSKGREMGRWQFRFSIEVWVDTKVAACVILKKICFCHTHKSCICSEVILSQSVCRLSSCGFSSTEQYTVPV